jgi:hypothetical protein
MYIHVCPHLNFSKKCPILTKLYVDVSPFRCHPNILLLFKKAVQTGNYKILYSTDTVGNDTILFFTEVNMAQDLNIKSIPR